MEIKKTKSVTVIVATAANPTGNPKCPRAIVSGSRFRFRDDYHGSVSIPKFIVKKIF